MVKFSILKFDKKQIDIYVQLESGCLAQTDEN